MADKGFDNGEHASACVPSQRSINNQGDGALFDRTTFIYEPEANTVTCSAGRTLVCKQLHLKKRDVT